MPLPRPRLAPVIMAILPFKPKSILFSPEVWRSEQILFFRSPFFSEFPPHEHLEDRKMEDRKMFFTALALSVGNNKEISVICQWFFCHLGKNYCFFDKFYVSCVFKQFDFIMRDT